MLRQILLIATFVLLLRLPFLNQPIQGDDVKYLAMAQQAQIDPLHPTHLTYTFQGQMVRMQGYPHPPLNAWVLAALIAFLGGVYEIPFHIAYLAFSLIAAFSMLALARRFSQAPVWATLLFIATPAFVISGTSFESDVPFVAFWLLGVALFVTAVDRKSVLALAGSAVALSLASMAAYQAILAAPILAYYLWERDRNWRPGWLGILTAPLVIMLFQLYEKQSSGTVPATVLAGYFQTYGLQQIANKLKNAAALTVHTGWIVFPLLAAVAFRKRWMFGVGAGVAGIFVDANPLFWVSFGIGAMVLASCLERRPDFLKAWVLIFFAGALVIFFAGSARYLLPMAAPVILLTVGELRWVRFTFVPQLALSIMLAMVNYQHWDGYRQFVNGLHEQIAGRRTWINGEWVQFYVEADGGIPVMLGQALRPGELVVSSDLGYPVSVTTGGGQLVPIAEREITSAIPLRLIGIGSRSGYSTASAGFRPFDISILPIDRVRAQLVVERKPAQSYLMMNAPEAENQIVSGLFGAEASWRWMGARAVILLKRPPEPLPLHIVFNIPDLAPARRVTVSLDGTVLEDQVYAKPGSYTLTTKPVTGSTVTISIDKTLSTEGDRRQLGIIISELGFR